MLHLWTGKKISDAFQDVPLFQSVGDNEQGSSAHPFWGSFKVCKHQVSHLLRGDKGVIPGCAPVEAEGVFVVLNPPSFTENNWSLFWLIYEPGDECGTFTP